MRFYLIMRRKAVLHGLKGVWRNFAKLWRIVSCKTLALLEMLSLGGIITMMRTDTQKKDLIEQWLMLCGDLGTLW